MSPTVDVRDLGSIAEKFRKFAREHPESTERIMRKHGGIIEAKAAVLTPVDKGFLRRANTSRIVSYPGYIRLTVENRMEYAPYQHNFSHRHRQPQARDHFISLPFFAELPALVSEIVSADMEIME